VRGTSVLWVRTSPHAEVTVQRREDDVAERAPRDARVPRRSPPAAAATGDAAIDPIRPAQFANKGSLRWKTQPLAGKSRASLSNAPTNPEVGMLTVLIPRSPRNVALSVAISGASGVAGLLEPITGCLSLLFVVLFAHFFGRSFGRLAAGSPRLG
jgi:hypothetical protein